MAKAKMIYVYGTSREADGSTTQNRYTEHREIKGILLIINYVLCVQYAYLFLVFLFCFVYGNHKSSWSNKTLTSTAYVVLVWLPRQ